MQKNNQEQSHESLWKSQEDRSMHITAEEVCARARGYEQENVWTHWIMLGFTTLLVSWYVYEVYNLISLHMAVGDILLRRRLEIPSKRPEANEVSRAMLTIPKT